MDLRNTYFTDFDVDRSKLLINKFFSITDNTQKTNSNFEIFNLLQDIGDKTFICVILLYFNSSGIFLFLNALMMKIIYINSKHYLYESIVSEYFFFKVFFPVKIFQFLGVLFYQLCGYSILFKMIFTNIDKSFKKIESEDLKENFTFPEKIKSYCILLFSLFSSFNLDDSQKQNYSFGFNKFLISTTSVIISLIIAIGIAHSIFKKFSKEFTLIITSITFLLLSIDGAVKVFTY